MVSFDEMLAAAVAAPRPHKDVVVPLTVDKGERDQLAADREALEQRLADAAAEAAKDPRLTSKPRDFSEEFLALQERENALDERDAAHMATIRVKRLQGMEWAELTARHTNGFGGYDLTAVCMEAARVDAATVADGVETPITDEQWETLLGLLSGASVDAIAAAAYNLNVADTMAEVERLGKASRPTPATDSD